MAVSLCKVSDTTMIAIISHPHRLALVSDRYSLSAETQKPSYRISGRKKRYCNVFTHKQVV